MQVSGYLCSSVSHFSDFLASICSACLAHFFYLIYRQISCTRMQICFTWIWDELLTKYVDAMVEHKTFSELRALRVALEEATREVRAKDDQVRAKVEQVCAKDEQVRAKDEQMALLVYEVVSIKAKLEESRASLRKFKMLFWGLLFACCAMAISRSTV
jgi:hypothetical protein